ncbi:hypothetical protein XENOCAPTIV_006999, partial [Xenoophorus captivus]
YVARCLENFLCDQSFWLDPELLSELEINVTVDEEHLATLYLGLLLQEGSFFAKALFTRSEEDEDNEEQLSFKKNDLLVVRDTGQDSMWEATMLSTGSHGQVPVNAMQPLPYPFYQGRQLVFLNEEEKASLAQVNPYSSEPRDSCLLERLFSSDISSVYRLDFKGLSSARQSLMSERSEGATLYQSSPLASVSFSSPRMSLHQSHNPLPQEGERLSFNLEDTFKELDEFQEDPPLFMEENSWEGEESELSDPTLTLFNHKHFQVSKVTVRGQRWPGACPSSH